MRIYPEGEQLVCQALGVDFRFARDRSLPCQLQVYPDGVSVSGEAAVDAAPFPYRLVPRPGDTLLLPVDEGMAIPVEDPAEYLDGCDDFHFLGRGATMGLVGCLRDGVCLLLAPEQPQDMGFRLFREDGLLGAVLLVFGEKGRLAYPRRVRFLAGDGIGPAMRAYAAFRGPTRTLADKARENPLVEKLLGSADVWVWDDSYETLMYGNTAEAPRPDARQAILDTAEAFRQAGIRNALFGVFFPWDGQVAQTLRERYGYLTAKYDNYNDVLPQEDAPFIPRSRIEACDYTARRIGDAPEGILVHRDGSLCRAWALPGTDGAWHEQQTLCPALVTERVRREVPAWQAQYPCDARFIDVLGGVHPEECWSARHPLTRTQCLSVKREAFSAVRELGLLAGTEDGSEALADVLDYTEGLHSPVYWRWSWQNCGRTKARRYGPDAAAYQRRYLLNPAYRVPLWQLAYHDAVVAFPYWGDSTACVGENTRRKTAFCRLYAAPPTYSFFAGDFPALRQEILSSCECIAEVTGRVGFAAMEDFRYLTDDRLVQETRFAGGFTVTANFSPEPILCRGRVIAPDEAAFFSESCEIT